MKEAYQWTSISAAHIFYRLVLMVLESHYTLCHGLSMLMTIDIGRLLRTIQATQDLYIRIEQAERVGTTHRATLAQLPLIVVPVMI